MHRRIGLLTLILAALSLVPASPDADAGMRRVKPARVVGKVVVYRLPHLQPARVRRARIQARGVRRPIALRRIRRAVRRGVLRTRIVRRERRRSGSCS